MRVSARRRPTHLEARVSLNRNHESFHSYTMTKEDGILRDAFRIIGDTINIAGSEGVLIDRDTLAKYLLGSELRERILARSEYNFHGKDSPFETAANYVDWFSSYVTQRSEITKSWNRSIYRARVITQSEATGKEREIWAYSVRSPTTRGRLIFRVGEGGIIRVGLIGKDGRWTNSDGLEQLPCGLYTVNFGRWAATLKELEDRINDPNCSEDDLQSFFEENRELLQDTRYKSVIPEAVIHRESGEVTAPWEADFILSPADQEAFCKIIELKRPQFGTIKKERRGHAKFYRELHEAISQLRDYHEAFDSISTREKFQDRYGVEVFKPDLQLIIGRRWTSKEHQAMLVLQRRQHVEIRSWDGELDRLRRLFT